MLPAGKNILLGQLGSNGDCLYATAVARQIKADYPGCKLTWAIGSAYRSVLDGNPHVDEIWEVPIKDSLDLWEKWDGFEKEAFERKRKGEFDEVFLTEIAPGNFKNFDGTVRASIFRGYPRPITVPNAPVMRLFQEEIENVRRFADAHLLQDYNHVILFESSNHSNQSFVTPEFALEVSQIIVEERDDVCVILSSNLTVASNSTRIIDGSGLTFRENAELTKYCTLLVGCSSGISWICTSDWATPLPMVQLLEGSKSVYASFVHDYEYRGAGTEEIIEMTDCSAVKVGQCLFEILTSGFASARSNYGERISVRFDFYVSILFNNLLARRKYSEAFTSLKFVVQRYGIRPQLIYSLFTGFIERVFTRKAK